MTQDLTASTAGGEGRLERGETGGELFQHRKVPRSIGVLAVGRATFDLDLARSRCASALDVLRSLKVEVVGDANPVLEPDAVHAVVSGWESQPELVVMLQATFTDARFAQAVAEAAHAPIAIWAFPEHRGGERLALNSLCGLILGAYQLAMDQSDLRWCYMDPDRDDAVQIVRERLTAGPVVRPSLGSVPSAVPSSVDDRSRARNAARWLGLARIGVVGQPPPGFGPCRVAPGLSRSYPTFESVAINDVLVRVPHMPPAPPPPVAGLEMLAAAAVDQSRRLESTLARVREERAWDALAVRCWPETFEQLGCAACSALAGLNDGGTPASCEADALGAATMLVLGWLSDSPSFLADVVDIDSDDDTMALWHCGVAPSGVVVPDTRRAALHPNRHVPLVHCGDLRPGVATIGRISQSRGVLRLVTGRVDVLDAPAAYLGSSGIVRFARPVDEVLATIIAEGLEHHLAIAYGDLTGPLRALASELGVPVVEL